MFHLYVTLIFARNPFAFWVLMQPFCHCSLPLWIVLLLYLIVCFILLSTTMSSRTIYGHGHICWGLCFSWFGWEPSPCEDNPYWHLCGNRLGKTQSYVITWQCLRAQVWSIKQQNAGGGGGEPFFKTGGLSCGILMPKAVEWDAKQPCFYDLCVVYCFSSLTVARNQGNVHCHLD